MTPEEEANELMQLFKEEEVFEYDIRQKHAAIRAVSCCEMMARECSSEFGQNTARVVHLRSVLKILNDKLK